MKKATIVLLFLVVLVARGFAASVKEKPALLLLPDFVPIREVFRAEVEFRWDEDAPVTLDIWSHDGRLSTNGNITVFDEGGKEVPMSYPMSMPLTPTGKQEVKKGEVLKIGLYVMGSVLFPRAGRYFAVATFSSAFSGEKNVRFTTKKRWFEVTDGLRKNL